jgi:hypothetical protein
MHRRSGRIQKDHLDDQTDDQSASDGEPDDKASKSEAITFGAATITLGSVSGWCAPPLVVEAAALTVG